jgi:hypothetical protein
MLMQFCLQAVNTGVSSRGKSRGQYCDNPPEPFRRNCERPLLPLLSRLLIQGINKSEGIVTLMFIQAARSRRPGQKTRRCVVDMTSHGFRADQTCHALHRHFERDLGVAWHAPENGGYIDAALAGR